MIRLTKSLATRFPFARNVVQLASGTVLGHAVMLLALPLLTRLYAPEDFGLLGIYMSVTMMLAAAACLCLEMAVPLPERDEDAVNLVALALLSASAVAVVLAFGAAAAPDRIAALLGQPGLRPYLWMVPPGVFLAAAYSALQFWSIRKGRFGQVARNQLTRAVGGAGAQLGLGLANPTPFGLLFGHLLYTGLGALGLARLFWKQDRALLSAIDRPSLARNFREQRRFPLYSVPETLLDNAAINLPLVLIAALAGPAEAGFMFLALRVTSIPIGLIGGSISRVYLGEAAERLRGGTLGPFTRRLMRTLLLLGAPLFLLMGLAAPWLFPGVFGPEWARAGTMVAWIALPMTMQFLASPVSTILLATNNQHIALLLQGFGFAATIGGVLLSLWIAPGWAFEAFAVGSTLYYAAYVAVVLYLSRK